jgi:methyl-accepting chemotaxis protein
VVVLRDANARIAVAVDGLSRSMADMARAIEEVRGEALEKAGETAKSLDGVSSELAKIRKETAALSRRIDEVKQAVAKAAGREPDTGAAPTSP